MQRNLTIWIFGGFIIVGVFLFFLIFSSRKIEFGTSVQRDLSAGTYAVFATIPSDPSKEVEVWLWDRSSQTPQLVYSFLPSPDRSLPLFELIDDQTVSIRRAGAAEKEVRMTMTGELISQKVYQQFSFLRSPSQTRTAYLERSDAFSTPALKVKIQNENKEDTFQQEKLTLVPLQWSPDEQRFYAIPDTGTDTVSQDLYRIDLQTKTVQKLASPFEFAMGEPKMDGRERVITFNPEEFDLAIPEKKPVSFFRWDLLSDKTENFALKQSKLGRLWGPDPSGDYVAYAHSADPALLDLWLYRFSDQTEEQLTDQKVVSDKPLWSNDAFMLIKIEDPKNQTAALRVYNPQTKTWTTIQNELSSMDSFIQPIGWIVIE